MSGFVASEDRPDRSTPAGPDAELAHPAVVEAGDIVRVRNDEIARRSRRRHRDPDPVLEPTVVAVAGAALFLVVGLVAAVRGGVLPGDAISRVVAAQAVVTGRDPHPEAIGFVWGPFPTLFEVPFVWLRHWWPRLTASGLAAVIVSAAFMGAMLGQLVKWGRDCGTPRWVRLAVVAVTALSPLVLLSGANGMSEACWLFFLVVAARQLARWLDDDGLGPLALCGLALALAYLTRYETVAAVLAAAVVVAVVSFRRAGPVNRVGRSVSDVAVVAFPPFAAFACWALASWAVVGEPFAQFSSSYGNSALVAAAGDSLGGIIGDLSPAGRFWFSIQQVLVAAPLVVVLALLALWIGDRATARAVAATAVLGAPVVAQVVFTVRGATFPWFRYVVGAVVLTSLLALVLAGDWQWVRSRRWVRPLAVLALIPGLVLSVGAVTSGSHGAVDDLAVVDGIRSALDGDAPTSAGSMLRRADEVASAIDGRADAAPGAVLTDVSSTFAVVAAAPRPDLYVVPSDRDFEAVVSDPATFGIRYVLLRLPAAPGDAVVAAHPGLTQDAPGADFESVATWGEPGEPGLQYRLYRVLDPAPDTRPTPEEGFQR